MAFFSKIKKLWSGEAEVGAVPAPADAASEATVEEQQQAAAEDGGARDAVFDEQITAADVVANQPKQDSEQPEALVLVGGGAYQAKTETPPAIAATPEPSSLSDQTWRDELLAALREPEPRIAAWLDIILRDVSEAGPQLWERLAALFTALDVPEAEAQAFVANFQDWLGKTDVSAVADFRSDLQYRLALALDMEEAPEEKKRFWHKLFQGLARTRNSITGGFYELFNGPGELDDDFWDELEELLVTSDVGMEAAGILLGRLQNEARKTGAASRLDIEALFIAEISAIFKPYRRLRPTTGPEVVLMVGVNGAGKTTTIAKLAYRAKLQGRKVLLAAADTFRAAAIEQLETWAGRVGVDFHAKTPGADPAAVAFEAMDRATAAGADLIFVDTAGRLQTKVNLM